MNERKTIRYRATFSEGGTYTFPVWCESINDGFHTALIHITDFINKVREASGITLEVSSIAFWEVP